MQRRGASLPQVHDRSATRALSRGQSRTLMRALAGNIDTLSVLPKSKGIDVRAELIAFHERCGTERLRRPGRVRRRSSGSLFTPLPLHVQLLRPVAYEARGCGPRLAGRFAAWCQSRRCARSRWARDRAQLHALPSVALSGVRGRAMFVRKDACVLAAHLPDPTPVRQVPQQAQPWLLAPDR
jgi:hypothetical protein